MEKVKFQSIYNDYIKQMLTKGYNHYNNLKDFAVIDNCLELSDKLFDNTILNMPLLIKKDKAFLYHDILAIKTNENVLDIIYDMIVNDEYFDLDPDRLLFYINKDYYLENEKKIKTFRTKNNFIVNKNKSIDVYYDRGEKYGVMCEKNEISENKRYVKLAVASLDFIVIYMDVLSMVFNKLETIYQTDYYLPSVLKLESICKRPYVFQKEFERIILNVRLILLFLASRTDEYTIDLLIKQILKDGIELCINRQFLMEIINIDLNIVKRKYPYIKINLKTIKGVIEEKESIMQNNILEAKNILKVNNRKKILDKVVLLTLYNKYEMPIELIYELASENQIKVNVDEFNRLKSVKNNYQGIDLFSSDIVNCLLKDTFVGYEKLGLKTKVLAIFKDNKIVDEIADEGYVLLEENPFLAFDGIQESDAGYLKNKDVKVEVVDAVKTLNNQTLLKCRIIEGKLKTNAKVLTHVLNDKRKNISKNHTVLHLLKKNLVTIFGDSINIRNSLVGDKTFKCDFAYKGKLSDELIVKIENMLNDDILKNLEVKYEMQPFKEVEKLENAKNVIGVDNLVRVVSIGDLKIACNGTFVKNTKEISKVAILGVENKGFNLYRIEGAVDKNIKPLLFSKINSYNDEIIKLLSKVKLIIDRANNMGIDLDFDFKVKNIKPNKYEDLVLAKNQLDLIKDKTMLLEKSFYLRQKEFALANIDLFLKEKVVNKNLSIIVAVVEGYDSEILKTVVESLKNRLEEYFILLASVSFSGINFFCVTNSEHEAIHCGNIVNELSLKCGGDGNGSKYVAQGGGNDDKELLKELEAIKIKLIKL